LQDHLPSGTGLARFCPLRLFQRWWPGAAVVRVDDDAEMIHVFAITWIG
jgi:hypothetical protein